MAPSTSGRTTSTTSTQVTNTTTSRPTTSTTSSSGATTRSTGSRTGNGTVAPSTSSHTAASDHGTAVTPRTTGNGSNVSTRPSTATTRGTTSTAASIDKRDNGGKPDNGNGGRPNGNGGKPDGKPNGNGGKPDGKPDNGGKPGNGNGGHGKGHGHGDGGKFGGNHGYDGKFRYDYTDHHYRDQFSWNYSHHNWSRACPPPARPYYLAPWTWYRPIIPTGWHPYAGAPVIDRILGLVFGTLFDASLDYLYYSGYFIDGYADGVIFLRDVPMLNLYWPDVMLNYDYNRLVNAQFVYHSSYYDTSRYNRVYRSLSRIYGSPVYRDGMTISWYGGNSTGWVTLTMNENYGGYYTMMSIGY